MKPADVKRVVDFANKMHPAFAMRCYELQDGTLIREDTLTPWQVSEWFTPEAVEVPQEAR